MSDHNGSSAANKLKEGVVVTRKLSNGIEIRMRRPNIHTLVKCGQDPILAPLFEAKGESQPLSIGKRLEATREALQTLVPELMMDPVIHSDPCLAADCPNQCIKIEELGAIVSCELAVMALELLSADVAVEATRRARSFRRDAERVSG